jgi:hypothetical protein
VGFFANPHFRGVLESEIPAFEVERIPEGAGSLEESVVAQGMKGSESPSGTLNKPTIKASGNNASSIQSV